MCLQDRASPYVGSLKAESGSSPPHDRQLPRRWDVSRWERFFPGKRGGKKPTLPALWGLESLKEGGNHFYTVVIDGASVQRAVRAGIYWFQFTLKRKELIAKHFLNESSPCDAVLKVHVNRREHTGDRGRCQSFHRWSPKHRPCLNFQTPHLASVCSCVFLLCSLWGTLPSLPGKLILLLPRCCVNAFLCVSSITLPRGSSPPCSHSTSCILLLSFFILNFKKEPRGYLIHTDATVIMFLFPNYLWKNGLTEVKPLAISFNLVLSLLPHQNLSSTAFLVIFPGRPWAHSLKQEF